MIITQMLKYITKTKHGVENQIKEDITNKKTPRDTIATLIWTQDMDIVIQLLAETVKAADWDGRYSRRTRDWAQGIKALPRPCVLNTHPAHINQIIEALIKYPNC